MSKEQILSNSKLIEEAVANDEGKLVSNGAFLALTGSRTGRSPKDRFIVEEASTRDQIEWGTSTNLLIQMILIIYGIKFQII